MRLGAGGDGLRHHTDKLLCLEKGYTLATTASQCVCRAAGSGTWPSSGESLPVVSNHTDVAAGVAVEYGSVTQQGQDTPGVMWDAGLTQCILPARCSFVSPGGRGACESPAEPYPCHHPCPLQREACWAVPVGRLQCWSQELSCRQGWRLWDGHPLQPLCGPKGKGLGGAGGGEDGGSSQAQKHLLQTSTNILSNARAR